MKLGIAGKTALVCGGSSGIGLGCAKVLAEEGVSVWIVGRDANRLEAAKAEFSASGNSVRCVSADLASPAVADQLKEAIGHVDILVTSPGGSPPSQIPSAGEQWKTPVDQFIANPIAIANVFLPTMIEQRFGRIVNIASSAFALAESELAFSGALRAALVHSASTLARRVGQFGVTVNNVAPGAVESDGLRHFYARSALEEGSTFDEVYARRLSEIPTRRFARTDEIGALVAYLSSRQAANITGRTIVMDGGANAYPFL
jgi:3-oxoacyl-[acyl-carrier protein] reductase